MDLSTFPKEEFLDFIIEKFPSALQSFLVKRFGASIIKNAISAFKNKMAEQATPRGADLRSIRLIMYLHLYYVIESALSVYKPICIDEQTNEVKTEEEPPLIILEDQKAWNYLPAYMKVNNISLSWARLARNGIAVQMSNQDSFCRLRAYLQVNGIDYHECASSGKHRIPLRNLQRRRKTDKRSHEVNRLHNNKGLHVSNRDAKHERVSNRCNEQDCSHNSNPTTSSSQVAPTSIFETSTSDLASFLTYILGRYKRKVLDLIEQESSTLTECSSTLEAIVNIMKDGQPSS